MKNFEIFVLVLYISFLNEDCASSICHWNSGCSYKYFSSKTPYDIVRGDIRDSLINLKGCDPISIWALYQHGKSNPNKDVANEMKNSIKVLKYVEKSHAAGKSSLCAEDVERLSHWKSNDKIFEQYSQLVQEGYNEMKEIGKRLKQAFSKLHKNLKDEKYIFQSNDYQCAQDSMNALVRGFGDDILTYNDTDYDEMLDTLETCKQYQLDIKNETKIYAEANKYRHHSEYLAANDRIRRRIGLEDNFSDDEIIALYDLCRYNSSGLEKSPWCALFTTDDLLVLEYEQDLRNYYRNGYGYQEAEILGRILLNNLLKTFKLSKEGNGYKIAAYITDGAMLDMTYTALGLFKDEQPLLAAFRDPHRKWRTSKISTFSSNLMAVLYKCLKNETTEYNVIFYVNEEPLFTICEEGVCSWNEFEEKLRFQKTLLDICFKPV